MNILLCGASMGIGGAETHMLTLAIGLFEKGHKVVVASERGALCDELKRRGIKFVRAPLASNKTSEIMEAYKVLKDLINRSEFDVVHSHSRISAFLIDKIRRKGKKRFKFIVTAHAHYRTNEALRHMSIWGDECIAVSKDIKDHLMKSYNVPARKIHVIPNGIDTNRYFPANRGSKYSVLFVSRLDSDCSAGAKALCRIAPRLFKDFERLKITVVGGGNDFKEVKCLAERANAMIGKEVIKLSGYCEDIVPMLQEHEYIVGVSRVALEAMAMQKSVVLFGNEGALGLLTEDNLGLAASSNFTCRGYGKNINSDFLLSELYCAFRMDDKKRKRTARLMRREVVEKYSHGLMCNMILKLYKINRCRDPKILIGGYYGQGNIGDERVLATLCRGLKNDLPESKVRVIKGGDHSFGSVNRKDLTEIVKAFKWSDVYISGGGSLFQNTTSTRSLIYYCTLIDLAKKMNNKVVVFSNGIGPLKGRFAEKLVGNALIKADYVSVRDMESFFKVISLTEGKVLPQLSADPVFAEKQMGLEGEKNGEAKKSLMDFGGKYIVVALNGRMGKLNRTLSMAIRDYCSKHEMLPIFVSMDTKKDTIAAREGAEICRGILLENTDDVTLNSVISRSSLAVGARFHFLIFSLGRGVQAVPINADPKINALSHEIFSEPALKIGKRDTRASIVKKMNCFLKSAYMDDEAVERERVISEMSNRAFADIRRVSRICAQGG